MKLIIEHKSKRYTVTFDEEGYMDTVENEKGKLLVSTNAMVKRLINQQQVLYSAPFSAMIGGIKVVEQIGEQA